MSSSWAGVMAVAAMVDYGKFSMREGFKDVVVTLLEL